jgi:uncharacterized protein
LPQRPSHLFSLQVDGHPIDCGFLVFNENTYPNMIGMFEELNVPTEPSDMSFAVSLSPKTEGGDKFEWSSTSLKGLFGSKGNATSGDFYSMLSDMLRFNKEAPLYLEKCKAASPDDPINSLTMGEFLSSGGYSASFKNNYLLPQMAAVWSASSSEVLKFPARTFITFSVNHSLLQVSASSTTNGTLQHLCVR